MSRIARLILFFVLLPFGLVFHLKNNQLVTLDYYLGTVEWPVSLIVILVLISGAVLGVLSSLPTIIKLKQQRLKLEKQIKNSEKEINTLRIMPIKD